MTVTTKYKTYHLGGIYRHYEEGRFFMIDLVSKLQGSDNIFLISYHECTDEGIYVTIRKNLGQTNEEIIYQPFCTHETEWNQEMDNSIHRFELFRVKDGNQFKQL